MAVLTGTFYSHVLKKDVNIDVILPQYKTGIPGIDIRKKQPVFAGKHPVLYFYHGHTSNHGSTIRLTSIERYALRYGLAVVFPSTHLSAFTNMEHGSQYGDYLTGELPEIMHSLFPLSDKREENFVAGISNGAVAAYRYGLSRPDIFSAIGCISGISISRIHERVGMNLYGPAVPVTREDSMGKRQRHMCFGDGSIKDTIHDTRYLAEKIIKEGLPVPRIYHSSGDDDEANYAISRADREFFLSFPGNPFDYTFSGGKGAHVWEYFEPHVEKFIDWLKLPKTDLAC
ncbi:esterase [Spirochaetia bacterium]|nr:esterase [Spirochaetia bacterium]